MVYVSALIFVCCICWVLLCQVLSHASGITLAPVYWNSSNTLFKQSKNTHVIEVSLQDQIDFVCPYYYPRQYSNTSAYEYYTVYQVSRQNYEDCNISSKESAIMIVNCSNPLRHKRFTILFEMFQAIPNAPEFYPGSTYYYTSTSTGQREGLSNEHLGACHWLNMRLIIHICCDIKAVDLTTSSSRAAAQYSNYFSQKSQISAKTVPPDGPLDIPTKESSFRKEHESSDTAPKHQGLTNSSLDLCHLHRISSRYLPCLISIFLYIRYHQPQKR